MKLAVFIKSTTFHGSYGGFETQNQYLCEGLAKRGHEVIVFSPQKELETLELKENGVRYVFVPCKFGKFRSLYASNKGSWENQAHQYFIKEHQVGHFDLVIGQSSWALPIIRHKKELGIKVVSIMHGTKMSEYETEISGINSPSELLKALVDVPHVLKAFFQTQREYVNHSDRLVAVSNYVKKAMVDETYVWESKITVINNGVDAEKIFSLKKEVPKNTSPVKIIYVGRIIKVKGLQKLVDALGKISNKNFILQIIGEGEFKTELEKLVNLTSFKDKVKFLGLVGHNQVLEELIKADLFVLPTLRIEGFPMTIVEAMFAGLPTVVSDIGGNSDAVVDGVTGYLVKPGNINELSEKIADLLDHPEKRCQWGENARKKAQNEFTIEKMLDKYEEVFKGLIK